VTVSTILELCREIPVRSFEPGAILLSEGKKSGLLYVLVEGEVEILRGEFQINTVSDRGAIFGEMSILLGSPHTATVRAVKPSRLHVIDDGDAFLQSNKEFSYDLAKVLAQRLHAVTTYLVNLNRYMHSV
jgi:CRP/FNR family cyclic AMP-dependent transcriptional regulator